MRDRLEWGGNLTARTYIADSAAASTLQGTGDKLNMVDAGKMTRTTGSGEFPDTILGKSGDRGHPGEPSRRPR